MRMCGTIAKFAGTFNRIFLNHLHQESVSEPTGTPTKKRLSFPYIDELFVGSR
jgi:hypothetical protein